MITVDDIANWFMDTFNADADLPGLIPGGMAAERAVETSEAPYGVFTVELAGDVTFNSGIQCYPEFTIVASIYADQDTEADTSGIQSRMLYAYPQRPASGALRNSGEYVLNMFPNANSAKFDPKLRNANDVVLNRFGWKVQCVGLTNVE